jgi:bifunctional non-homologous end joining protein LigD
MARAKTSSCPAKIALQLVTLANTPPRGEWLYEIKFDGFRIMARFDQGVRLLTRIGFDWTQRMPRLVKQLETLKLGSAWVDDEVIVQDKEADPYSSRCSRLSAAERSMN